MRSRLVGGSEDEGWTFDVAFTFLSFCVGYTLESDADGSTVTFHLGPLHLRYWKASPRSAGACGLCEGSGEVLHVEYGPTTCPICEGRGET